MPSVRSITTPIRSTAKNGFENFSRTGETKARYVRLKALNNGRPGGWIFTDEIVVE